jgi:DNA mismatch repair protein MutL
MTLGPAAGADSQGTRPAGPPAPLDIRLLPPELVDKIAAGEVVERPVSVVKELVENALDAGATAVRVEVQRGGFTLLRVSDDGSGIRPDQLELAVCRHATSKLVLPDDLFHVRTLGFRGEALASIAAVSHLEIVSRVRGSDAAHTLRLEGGNVVFQGRAGAPEGTTVTVRRLFFNVPARHAFQRTPPGEARQIVQLCSHLALAAPHVRFTVEVDGRAVLQTPGAGGLREALAAVYAAETASRMLALPVVEESGVRAWGYCSGPEEHRNTRLYLTFCVNGRLVRSPMLSYAVEEAYYTLLPSGRHPLAVVYLELPPDEVDVNVHPTKLEIRLRRERLAFALVRNAVREALREFAPVPALHPSAIGGPEPSAQAGTGLDPAMSPDSGSAGPSPSWPAGDGASGDPRQGTPGEQPSLLPAPPMPPPPAAPPLAPAGAGSQAKAPARRTGLRALGQVGLTYVVAEDASGVYLIDQHSAHERVLYEQLLRGERADGLTAAQLLLAPEAVELTGAQDAWLREYGDALAVFGYQLEPFGGLAWLLRAVPRAVAAKGRIRALAELIDGLIEHEYGDGPVHDQARWAVACHSAVRAGDQLMPEEMAALISQLEQCDMRRTCPHGRPTMIHLSHAQLEREFGRR